MGFEEKQAKVIMGKIISRKTPVATKAQQLRYCPICHQVWQLEYPSNKKIIHSDFPSYGLPRDVCFDCKEVSTN